MKSGAKKILILSVLCAVSALFFGYTFAIFSRTPDLNSLALPLAAIILFLALFSLQIFLVPKFRLLIILCLLESLFIFLPFYKEISLSLLANFVFLFVALLLSAWNGKKELENKIKINPSQINNKILKTASLAIIVFGITIYLGSISFEDLSGYLLTYIETISQSLVQQVFPQLPTNMLQDAQTLLAAQIQQLPPNIKQLSVLVFGLVIFLAIRSVFFLLNFVVQIFFVLIYKILLKTKFFTISSVDAQKEIISF